MGLSLRPFKKALDFGSRVYDQVNPLDNGRSWQTRESTYQGSPIRDTFDANSASDQQKRVQAQMPRYYKDEQKLMRRDNVQSVEENPFKRVWAETTEAPRRVGFGLSSTSKTGGDVQDSYLQEQRYTQDNELKAMKKLKDPTVSPQEKQRWYNYLVKSYEGNQQRQADISKEIGMQVKDADPVAMTAALAEMGVDVATLGMGGVVFKGGRVAAKQGAKEVSKYLAKNIIKPVIPGAVGGGLGAFTSQGQDTTAQQVGMGVAAGAGFGLALPVALLGGEKLIRGVGGVSGAIDNSLSTKFNPAAKALQDDYVALNTRWQTATPQMRKNIEKAIKLNRDEFDKVTQIGSAGRNVLPDAPDPTIIPRTEISDLTDAELYKQINDLKKTVGTPDFDRKLSNTLQEELTVRQTGAESRLEAQSRAAGLTRGSEPEIEVPTAKLKVEDKPTVKLATPADERKIANMLEEEQRRSQPNYLNDQQEKELAKTPVKLKDVPEEQVTGKELADRYQAMKNAGMDDADIEAELSSLKTADDVNVFDQKLKEAIDTETKLVVATESQIRRMGFEPEEIRQKMQASNRGEYKMTPEEIQAGQMLTKNLDEGRAALEASGEVIEGSQTNYTPQVKKGDTSLPESREDLANFGYKESRTNAIDLQDLEYGNMPEIDYLVKSKHRDLIAQKITKEAALIDGRQIDDAAVVRAAKQTVDLQKKINDKSQSDGVLKNDTTGDLYKIGKDEGYTQTNNTYSPGMVTQEPKAMLEQAGVYKNGFEQYDNSVGYANEFATQVKEYGVNEDQVADALEKAIRSRMPNADASSVSKSIDYTMRTMKREGINPEEAASLYERAFRNSAKSEMMRLGKTTNFTDSKMNKVINEQINGRLLIDAWNKNAAQNLDQFLAERINVSLRGLNIVSALFELGDTANVYAKFGIGDIKTNKIGLGKIDGDRFGMTRRYGQSNAHFASTDIPEITKLENIWTNPNWNIAKKVYESYRNTENKLLFFKYIEEMKTELYFRTADNFYRKQGLEGGDLVDKVMEDYLKTMLPSKLVTANRILGKFPKIMTQYLNWSLQATKRLGRTISGSDEGGKFAGKSRVQRISRGVVGEIVPKVGVAALLGVPIMQILGMRDFTGTTEGDFTGIDPEDKETMDRVVSALSVSPTMSVAANFYFADRRNDIADQKAAAGETYGAERRPEDTPLEIAKDSAMMLVPFRTQFNKSNQVQDASEKGYYANRDGRIQAEGPTGFERVYGSVVGKNYTQTIRDYQDAPSALSVLRGDASVTDLITKNQSVSNTLQNITGKGTRDYNRPLTVTYSDVFKEADDKMRTALLDGGRKYNSSLDNLKKSDPENYTRYINSLDNNSVSPEYWRTITGGNSSEGADLTVFNMLKERKTQLLKDMNMAGKNKDGKYDLDPIYSLPDNQARQVLQQKSTATGEDLALRNILYKEQWYQDYMDKQSKYYENKPASDGDFKETERVKKWNSFNDSYNELSGIKGDTLKTKYPLVWQLKDINNRLGYKTDASEAELDKWSSATWEAYNAQKDAVDAEKLAFINQMREIENVGPMSVAAYQQATEIADTSGTEDSKWNEWGSGTKSAGTYAVNTKVSGASNPKVSVKAPKIGKFKVAGINAGSKPKVSMKKSLV